MTEKYHPCRVGIHVCGKDAEEFEPITLANIPFPDDKSAADAFARAGERCAKADDEPQDCVVDLMSGGDIVEDFSMTRQMLDVLWRMFDPNGAQGTA